MPTGAQSLAEGILMAGQALGRGLQQKMTGEAQGQEKKAKSMTLAELIALGQQQPVNAGYDISGAEGPQLPDMQTQYPDVSQLRPDLAEKAARYDLLPFYLELKKANDPKFEIKDGSIIRFPAGGGMPGLVGQLPQKETGTPEQKMVMEVYRNLVQSGVPPQAALEKAMILKESGKIATQNQRDAAAGGRNDATNKTRLQIAKMNNDTKRFVAGLAKDAAIRKAEISAGKDTSRAVDMVIPSYPGKIGGSLLQMHYKFNPSKPESITAAVESIDTRMDALNKMAATSGAKKGAKLLDPSSWANALKDDEAKAIWEQFTAQFQPGYEPTGEELSVSELPGDLELMGQEYVNLANLKDHIQTAYTPAGEGGANAPESQQQAAPQGESPELQQKRAAVLQWTRQMGGDSSMVMQADSSDIEQAYEQLQATGGQ